MGRPSGNARRWLRRAALTASVVAVSVVGWSGYRAPGAQVALDALWSLCAPVR
jgi:hypothetical protein